MKNGEKQKCICKGPEVKKKKSWAHLKNRGRPAVLGTEDKIFRRNYLEK
jgi:hypothetical protein